MAIRHGSSAHKIGAPATTIVKYVMRFSAGTKPIAAVNAVLRDAQRRGWKKGNIMLELHKYGDPDGNGDLQRTNQYALEYTKPKEASNGKR